MIDCKFVVCLALILSGCGPLTTPVVERLSPEEQANDNESWKNMLAPPDRLDRTLLLDVLLCYQMHQRGVDRLRLISQKDVPGGMVTLQIDYDLLRPDDDRFSLTYIDRWHRTLRSEQYTREDVENRLQYLIRPLHSQEGGSEVPEDADAQARGDASDLFYDLPSSDPASQDSNPDPAVTDESVRLHPDVNALTRRQAEREARQREIIAATQPAVSP